MARLLAWAVAAPVFSGCHAPTPSFDFFSPYAPPRVPPPTTGSYGSQNQLGATATPYYEGAVSSRTTTTTTVREAKASESPTQGWRSADSTTVKSDIALASHEEPATIDKATTSDASPPANSGDVVRIVESTAPPERVASVEFKGMPLNDATIRRQPQLSTIPSAVASVNVSSGDSVTVLPGSAPLVTPWGQPVNGSLAVNTPTPAPLLAGPVPSLLQTPTPAAAGPMPTPAAAPRIAATTSVLAEPGRFNPSEQLIEITQLPGAESGSSAGSRLRGIAAAPTTLPATEGSVVVQASANVPVTTIESSEPAKAAAKAEARTATANQGWKAR